MPTYEEIMAEYPGVRLDEWVQQYVIGEMTFYRPPEYSARIEEAWKLMQLIHKNSGRRNFMHYLQAVVSINKLNRPGEYYIKKLILWPDVMWHVTPEHIAKAALLAVVEGS